METNVGMCSNFNFTQIIYLTETFALKKIYGKNEKILFKNQF
jgi:hypothetical protein